MRFRKPTALESIFIIVSATIIVIMTIIILLFISSANTNYGSLSPDQKTEIANVYCDCTVLNLSTTLEVFGGCLSIIFAMLLYNVGFSGFKDYFHSLNLRKRSKQGVAGVIVASVMILFVMAIFFAYLNYAVQSTYTTISNTYGLGIFNPIDDLNFALQIWYFWLLIILFAVAVYVFQSAQQRRPSYDV